MVKGIKAKDIRDFEKYAQKLSDVLSRIREYKPEANAFLVCGVQTYLCLMSDDHCDYDKDKQTDFIVTEVDMIGFDGGVTVQDGKPLEEFLHPIDAYKGLKAKYLVFKADTGKVVDNCFILRPDKDAAAVEALRAYANATDNKTLAEDIYSWVGKGEQVQEWISVKDRLPEEHDSIFTSFHGTEKWQDGMFLKCSDTVLASVEYEDCKRRVKTIVTKDGKWDLSKMYRASKVTHWMPLPQPPKEG